MMPSEPAAEQSKQLPAGNLAGIDATVPHSARVWNYWLGGKDNFAADRAAGDAFVETFPGIVDVARASRNFLVRAVRMLAAEEGIRQFLDVGSGLPTAENTHEVAQAVVPNSRVVYVDNDPIVLIHARALLTGGEDGVTAYVEADLTSPRDVLSGATATLDLGQPVAVILNGVMGHVGDTAQAAAIVRELMSALVPGSYLVLSDGTAAVDDAGSRAQDDYNASGAEAYHLRTPAEIAGFFSGLEILEPGVVSLNEWRPLPGQEPGPQLDNYGGVARKNA
jgi:SAM-dependent methyltransferase